MNDSKKFDVVIIGGGIAGLSCGLRAAELGLQVGILEQGADERYLCNTRYSGGAFHVCFHEIHEDESVLLAAINERTRGTARADYAQAVAKDARIAVKWLKGNGIKFIKAGADSWRWNTLAPPLLPKPGLHWQGRGGDVMMRTLTDTFKRRNGTLLLGARALALRMDAARCVGVDIEDAGTRSMIEAGNVVICDGGFQGNLEMLREFISSAPDKLKQRGAATGRGDGIRMARAVGAQTVGMERFYGHLLAREAMHNDALWPFPMVDYVCQAGLVIDGSGRRFMDEGLGGVYMANQIARLADPLSTAVIYDDAIWNGPAREFVLPANPNLEIAGATILKAPDLASLAAQLGVPADALGQTVAAYNEAVDTGRTAQLTPARSSAAHKPHPIRKAPFYALPMCAGITFTMGGVAIDGDARVLNARNEPIAGLYAAGCTTGGLEGGELAGYVGGLVKSAVMGMRAAQDMAANRRG